jgi:HAAS domain-containing protein
VRQPGPIADYLDALARELGLDIALSRRVCAEVEDHLWQVTDGCTSIESQQQAVANFGDPRDIARQYITATLLAHIRWVGLAMIGAATAIFLAMKARVVWYALMQWESNAEWDAIRAIGLAIDRYGFLAAISIALIGWVYINTRRAPIRLDVTYNKELNHCIVLCGAAAAGLIVSVTVEAVLTGIRLFEMEWCAAALVPILSLIIEMAAAALLVLRIRAMIRRTAIAFSVFETTT